MRLMQRPVQSDARHARRDPAHELYDQACELLVAARSLRAAAGARGSAPAFAATAGCLEASLEALADAARAMRREAVRQVLRPDPSPPDAESAGRAFSELAAALASAHRAAGQLRERSGPMLARLTLP